MAKRIDFKIDYQKTIDRCEHKIAILSAEGLKSGYMVAALKTAVELAEEARNLNNDQLAIQSLLRMKELLK